MEWLHQKGQPLSPKPEQGFSVCAEGAVNHLGNLCAGAKFKKHFQEERLFKTILALDRDKAKQELERLYSSGNPQARSYALVGMRKLHRKRYAELLAAARASDVTVKTIWGCIVENEKLRTVANDLDSGKYDPWLR